MSLGEGNERSELTMFSVTEEMWLELRLQVRSLKVSAYSWQPVTTWVFRSKIPEVNLKAEVICRIYVADIEEVLGTSTYSREEELEYYEELVAAERSYLESLLDELPKHKARINMERDVIFEILEPDGTSPRKICYLRGDEVIWETE